MATTDLDPSDDAGTVKVADSPLVLVVAGKEVVVTVLPSNDIVTSVLRSNPIPIQCNDWRGGCA